MKKYLIITIVLLLAGTAFAGDIRTTPSYIVLTQPTTNKVELISQNYHYGAAPYLDIEYNVLDSNGSVRATHVLRIEGEAFTTFTSGFVTTMVSRGDASVWADILGKYTVQATP